MAEAPEEIKVGEALFDYVEQVTEIVNSLVLAEQQVGEVIELFPENYLGEANPEMEAYLSSLYSHIQKQILFYGNLASYINNVFETVEDYDKILADYLENHGYVAVGEE